MQTSRPLLNKRFILRFKSSYKSNLYNFVAIDFVQIFNKIWLLI